MTIHIANDVAGPSQLRNRLADLAVPMPSMSGQSISSFCTRRGQIFDRAEMEMVSPRISIIIIVLLSFVFDYAVSRAGFNLNPQQWTQKQFRGRIGSNRISASLTSRNSLVACTAGHIGFVDFKQSVRTALVLRGGSADTELREDNPNNPDSLIIGPFTNFTCLEDFYSTGPTNQIFLTKIAELKRIYAGIRTVKGDGNCFIRGYIFQVMESCIANRTEAGGLQGLLTGYYFSITDQSRGLGYSPIAIDDFYQDVQNQVRAP
jgi:hypothetical protein